MQKVAKKHPQYTPQNFDFRGSKKSCGRNCQTPPSGGVITTVITDRDHKEITPTSPPTLQDLHETIVSQLERAKEALKHGDKHTAANAACIALLSSDDYASLVREQFNELQRS